MATGTHHVEVDVPLSIIWEFVNDMDQWAPLVPGYVGHKMVNARKSVWQIKGELGKIQKVAHLYVNIEEVHPPTYIGFTLSGLRDTCTGHGHFLAETITDSRTLITGTLDISAKGMMAPMINSVLNTTLPKFGEEFTKRIANEIVTRRLARA